MLVLFAGCQGGAEPEVNPVAEEERPWREQEARTQQPLQAEQHCPVRDQTVQVALEERPDGAALVFRTSGDVDALQQDVRALARGYDRHQERALRGSTHRPPTRAEGAEPPYPGMPPAEVRVEDLDDGARVILVGDSPGAREQIRARLENHRARLRQGHCVSFPAAGS